MVTPVTSSAAQQQSFVQSTPQAGSSGGAGAPGKIEENFKDDETRPAGTSAAESQKSETRNNGEEESKIIRIEDENASSVQFTGNEERGSVVDISV